MKNRDENKSVMVIRCPKKFVEAIDEAANSKLLTKSDYVRQATLEALKADGVSIA